MFKPGAVSLPVQVGVEADGSDDDRLRVKLKGVDQREAMPA